MSQKNVFKKEKFITAHEASEKYKAKQAIKAERKRIKTPFQLLKSFHLAANEDPSNRLELLLVAADAVFSEVDWRTLKQRRENFDRCKLTKFPIAERTPCWACRLGEATVRHHIILLKHGGPVTRPSNIVSLCKDCHAKIHPWMEVTKEFEPTTPQIRAAMSAFLLVLEKVESRSYLIDKAKTETLKIVDALFSTSCEQLNTNYVE